MKLGVDRIRSNVASRPNSCRRAVGIILLFIRAVRTENRKGNIYINRKGYKVTRCRELKPPVAAILPLKRITDERNEVGWRTNGGLRRKKEKREKEGWKKRRRGNKGKKKYWKKRRRERKESSRTRTACWKSCASSFFLVFTHPPPLFKSDTLDFEANKYLSNVSRREVNEGKLGRSGKQRGAKGRERERKKKV